MNTKTWNPLLGFWQWLCGCVRYQDGYDLCDKHKTGGYRSLENER